MAISLIVFGLIGYWVYWSIKHEGIYWIPKASLAIGGFILFLGGALKLIPLIPKNLFANGIFVVIYVGVTYLIQMKLLLPVFEAIENKIKERIGKDPYGE